MVDVLQHLPNCQVFSTVKQSEDEQEWLAARTRGIGGSDVGAICGVSNYSTARNIYFKKTGQYTEPDGGEFSKDAIERMRFGNLLEPIVAAEYAHRTGKKIICSPATLTSKEEPWAIANVDRFIVDDNGIPYGVLECKTAGHFMMEDWEEGDLPLSYIYQLQWYLWVTGLKYGVFACLVAGQKFFHYEVYRNDDLLNDVILPAVRNFWGYNVALLIEPQLDGTLASTELINEIGKECIKNSELVIEGDEYNELAETVIVCKAKIKELEKIEDEAANRIKDKMRTAELGYTQDFICKWSPQSQKRIDTDALKSKYPKIAEECTKTISFRKFTVKGVK